MKCLNCGKDIDDEEPICIGDIQLKTCWKCYQ